MRRVLIPILLLAFAAEALATLTTAAQALPSKKEAAAIMQKAFAAMNLTSPGSPPFHLVAQIHYELGGDGRDGVFELFWAAPDRWREGFKMDRVDSEIDIALGDKLYTLRHNASASLPLLRVRRVLHPGESNAVSRNFKVGKVTSEQLNGEQVTCFDSKRGVVEERTCFDSPRNQIVDASYRGQTGWTASLDGERSDFVAVGDRRYPRHFVSHYFDENMDIRITTLAVATDFPEGVFTPQLGAAVSDWCAAPVEKGETSPGFGRIILHEPALVAYDLLIARDGKVEKSAPLRPADPNEDTQLNTWFREARFPKKFCGANPIEYERLFYLPNNLE